MKKYLRFLAGLLVVSSTISIVAQNAADDSTAYPDSTAPVAFIYVANQVSQVYNTTTDNLYAYTAAANGKLTLVPGAPFSYGNVSQMAVNGKYLFGLDENSADIDSFLMESNGVPKLVEKNNVLQLNPDTCSIGFGPITVDHTGSNLYNLSDNSDCDFYQFESFGIASSTGKLSYRGEGNTDNSINQGINGPLAILGNDKFAYSANCFFEDGEADGGLRAYQLGANGVLNNIDVDIDMPNPPNDSSDFYCPYSNIATDPTNHVLVELHDLDFEGDSIGKTRIGIFTATSTGALTTNSTYSNMATPDTDDGWIRMAPSGKLLAVGSLEIFHFNGSKLTKFADLGHYLGSEFITEFYWDNANHLYAIGQTSHADQGKLFVFTITPTSVTEAPGSPYSIPNPTNIIVQPRP